VEPLARPFLAEVRRCKQMFHLTLISARTSIGDEGVDLGRGWREACQGQAQTTQQRGSRSLRRWLDVFPFEACENKRIDGIADLTRARHPRRLMRPDWLECPVRGGPGGQRLRSISVV